MTIGVKREDKLSANPGHTPLDDDKNLRARSPETQFGNKSCRMESSIDASLGPGYYNNTVANAANVSIGVRREGRVERTPGPADYNL